MITQHWHHPAVIARNNFIHKSLSCWSYNMAIGCAHACRFCYVPEVSTNRMARVLKEHGVQDPDAEWGEYVFLRKWNHQSFLTSLRKAENTPVKELNADGNRAVMFSTTTDPYQAGKPFPCEHCGGSGKVNLSRAGSGAYCVNCSECEGGLIDFNERAAFLTSQALGNILHQSTLNVRILTRSPLARRDFDLMRAFGNRLLFGMSLPTLNNQLARIYEPKAPAPTQRLETLRAAKAAGIPIYVAVAPVYPDCDAADMLATLKAVWELKPHTIYMEPINIRADNVQRIEAHAKTLGLAMKTDVFATREAWGQYAFKQLKIFQGMAVSLGIPRNVLHLWPDQSLTTHIKNSKSIMDKPDQHEWLNDCWNKISAWPKA